MKVGSLMLIGRSQSKIVPDFLRPSAARKSRNSSRSESVSGSRDSYIPSRSVTQSEGKSSVGKTIALTAIGAAVGVGIAALSAPLAGALILGGGIGAIAGAAIGQGALSESSGSYDPKKSNPYTDPFHPDSPLNPNNPNNPIYWAD